MELRTSQRNQIIAGIIIIAIIFIVIAYFASKKPSNSFSVDTATSSASSATSTVSVPGGFNAASSSNVTDTVKPSPVQTSNSGVVVPNYKAPLIFSDSSVPASVKTSMQSQFAQVQAALAQSPTDFNEWIELGVLRKEAGDYAGAEADWLYMSQVYPGNVVSNANLGDLYTNYLHNYPKAAAAYKAQIAIVPTDTSIYDNLYSLYTNQYPQSNAVIVAMLKAGIVANPSAAELKADLAKYQ